MNSERWLFEDNIDPAIHAEIQKMLQPLAKDLKAQCLFGARERSGAAFDMGTTALPQPATGVLTGSETYDPRKRRWRAKFGRCRSQKRKERESFCQHTRTSPPHRRRIGQASQDQCNQKRPGRFLLREPGLSLRRDALETKHRNGAGK